MLVCKIAEMLVAVQAENLDSVCLCNMENFIINNNDGSVHDIEVRFLSNLPTGGTLLNSSKLLDEGLFQVFRDKDYYNFNFLDKKGNPPGVMRINTNYDEVILNNRPTESLSPVSEYHPLLNNKDLLNLAFRLAILFHHGLVLHASAVKYKGECYAFLGNSGTGKTTHTDLWVKYFGAVKLNDDSPAVRLIDGKAAAYGTPWSGSVDCYVNDSAPLKGLCVLKQAKENKLSRLEPVDAFAALFPMCTVAVWDQRLVNLTMNHLNELVQAVPVYLLQCRPDLEAAELALSVMK